MSGAGVFAGGLLIGVLVIDDLGYRGARLSAVQVHRLASDPLFTLLVEAGIGGLVGPEDIESVELRGLLQAPTTELPPLRMTPLVSPATLLRAEQEVVRFHGREPEFIDLTHWCESSDISVGIRLIVGPGGLGKTRLARQFAKTLLARSRGDNTPWVAGFLKPDPDPPGPPLDLHPLADVGSPLLIILDYAEARVSQLNRLLPLLWDLDISAPLRLLLLARTAGDWWHKLILKHPRIIDAPSLVRPLGPLDNSPEMRRLAFEEAVTHFTSELAWSNSSNDWGNTDDIIAPADLDADRYGSPLTLQMSALLTLLLTVPDHVGDIPLWDSYEAQIVSHEERYWIASAHEQGLHLHENTLRMIVGAASLLGVENEEEGVAVLSRFPGISDQSEDKRVAICSWLHDLYPPSSSALYWGVLQPDRLAEHLVADLAERNHSFLETVLAAASDSQLARGLSLLARAQVHEPQIAGQFQALLERNRSRFEPLIIKHLAATPLDVDAALEPPVAVPEDADEPALIWKRYMESPVVLV
jgi:hypothetical protein